MDGVENPCSSEQYGMGFPRSDEKSTTLCGGISNIGKIGKQKYLDLKLNDYLKGVHLELRKTDW
jgi:hypothetical protein